MFPPFQKDISIIARYTAYTWFRNGLLPHAFLPDKAALFYWIVRPVNSLLAWFFGNSLEAFLLQRHLIIDHLLERELGVAPVTAVVEIGAGYSARGHLLLKRLQGQRLIYLELDLPNVVACKRQMLEAAAVKPLPLLLECDINARATPDSLREIILQHVPRQARLVLLTEGLMDYFGKDAVHAIWTEMADILRTYEGGVYLSDIAPRAADHPAYNYMRTIMYIIQKLVGRKYPPFFANDDEVAIALRAAGFNAEVLNPAAFHTLLPARAREPKPLVRLIRATV